MTQKRYQEAAEECGRIAGIRQSYDQTDQADLMILARDILSKLASGWVLVPHPCRGIPDPACNYLAACGQVCNKCGTVHRQHLLAAAPKP
jgi:hypothetical protein